MKKHCIVCNSVFETKNPNQICCGYDCKIKRAKEISKKYREEHRDEIRRNYRKFTQKKSGSDNDTVLSKSKIYEVTKKDPRWVQDYCKTDRLTQISMLAKALTEYNIELISYGRLVLFWGTSQYTTWEEKVIELKRKEHVTAEDTIKSKDNSKKQKAIAGKD